MHTDDWSIGDRSPASARNADSFIGVRALIGVQPSSSEH
jgi:hypothetical protein